ncbi:S-methyl-5-thioribose-1-phosphate isomerase [Lactovum odontotermitis]
MDFKTLEWNNQTLRLLDQTKLPNETVFVDVKTVEGTYDAILTMIVRGAPAIGVAAGYGMALAAYEIETQDVAEFLQTLKQKADYLKSARPTAVNLSWAVDEIMNFVAFRQFSTVAEYQQAIEEKAVKIHEDDIKINKQIGENLISLIKPGSTILNHCNAGALATSQYGTSLSIFYVGKEKGLEYKAFVDETRPRQQGARLTAFELFNSGIDTTLITDNMAAEVMKEGKVDAVIVGCDRIAKNGDTANKIGTMGVAVLAKHFGIPFYVAAPTPTIDFSTADGSLIPIEERDSEEITVINGEYVAPKGVKTYNPGFDVTPADLITAIVTEKGILKAPFSESIEDLKNRGEI